MIFNVTLIIFIQYFVNRIYYIFVLLELPLIPLFSVEWVFQYPCLLVLNEMLIMSVALECFFLELMIDKTGFVLIAF